MPKILKLNLLFILFTTAFVSTVCAQDDFKRKRFEVNISYSNLDYKDYYSIKGVNTLLSIERILDQEGNFGLKFNLDSDKLTEHGLDVVTVGLGADLNWYPFGEAKWLYLGPGLKGSYYHDAGSYYNNTFTDRDADAMFSLSANIGSQFQITRFLGVRLRMESDLVYLLHSGDFGDITGFKFGLGVNYCY